VSLGVRVAVLAGRGLSTVGRGTVDILVRAPSLGAPFVGIVVVPLIVRLGLVGLSTGVVEAGLLMEVLIATIGVPLVAGVTRVHGALALRCLLEVGRVTGLGAGRSGSTVLVVVAVAIAVAILSPLVVISADLAGVVLVIVRTSLDGVVRLAPPGVLVFTVGLLGPGVVVVSVLLLSGLPGGTLLVGSSVLLTSVGLAVRAMGGLTVRSVGTVGRFAVTVAVSLGDGLLAVASVLVVAVRAVGLAAMGSLSCTVVGGGGVVLLGGCTIGVLILAPRLSTMLVIILVVPLIVGLGAVRLGLSVAVGLVNGEILIATPGVPVGSLLLGVVLSVILRGLLGLLGGLDNLGVGNVVDLGVATVALGSVSTVSTEGASVAGTVTSVADGRAVA